MWELLEVRDTTSNTLDSIAYTPLGLIFRGGQGTGDRGLGTVGTTSTTSNTLDSIGYTPLGLIFRGGQWTGDWGQGGTTRRKRHDIKHIGLPWIHTFTVNL